MHQLKTRSGNRPFGYDRLADGCIQLRYGKGYETLVDAEHIKRLLATFKGQAVALGTSRDNPPAGSIGEWLQKNVTKTAIASYIGPILVHEGRAEWGPSSGKALVIKIR